MTKHRKKHPVTPKEPERRGIQTAEIMLLKYRVDLTANQARSVADELTYIQDKLGKLIANSQLLKEP